METRLYGNLPYKCSTQQKRQNELVVRDKMNSIRPMNFFRTTDTTIWKPGLTPETSAFQSLYGGHFTFIINSVDKPYFRVSLPHRRGTTVSSETNPLYLRFSLFLAKVFTGIYYCEIVLHSGTSSLPQK